MLKVRVPTYEQCRGGGRAFRAVYVYIAWLASRSDSDSEMPKVRAPT